MESEERAAWSVYTNPFLLEQIVTSAKVKDLHLYDASSEFSKEMLEVASYLGTVQIMLESVHNLLCMSK